MAELASGMEQSQPEIDQLIADATNDALGHHHGGAGATPPPNGQPGPNGRANNLANAYGGPLQPAVLLADRPHKAGGGCGNCGGHDCDCEHSPDRVGKPTWTFKGQAILFGRTIAAAPLGFVTGLLTILNVVTSIPAILGWLVGPVVLGSITRALTPELFRKYNSWTTRTFFWERWVFSLKSLEGTLTGDGANNGNRLERFSTAKVNEPMIPGIKAFGLAILFIPGGLATIVCALFAVVHAPFSLLNTGLTVGRTKLGKLTSFVEPEEFRPYTVLLTRNLPWDDLAYSLKS